MAAAVGLRGSGDSRAGAILSWRLSGCGAAKGWQRGEGEAAGRRRTAGLAAGRR